MFVIWVTFSFPLIKDTTSRISKIHTDNISDERWNSKWDIDKQNKLNLIKIQIHHLSTAVDVIVNCLHMIAPIPKNMNIWVVGVEGVS